MKRLAYGFVHDFGGIDAILFAGEAATLRRFAKRLREIASQPRFEKIQLDDPELFEPTRATRVLVSLGGSDSAASAITGADGVIEVTWTLSAENAVRSAEALEALAESHTPGHQYLEGSGDIQIIVSSGEGDETVLKRSS